MVYNHVSSFFSTILSWMLPSHSISITTQNRHAVRPWLFLTPLEGLFFFCPLSLFPPGFLDGPSVSAFLVLPVSLTSYLSWEECPALNPCASCLPLSTFTPTQLIEAHGFKYHLYNDDSQIWKPFPSIPEIYDHRCMTSSLRALIAKSMHIQNQDLVVTLKPATPTAFC